MAQPSRSSTTRMASQRPASRTDHKGRLHIVQDRIPDDKHYLWVRETCLGQPDSENVAERMMDGYSPVPADRHPEMMPPLLDGQRVSPYIRRGGQILMEMSRADHDEQLEQFRQENAEIVGSVDRDRQAKAGKDIPATAELSSRVERNGKFSD